MDTTKKLGKVLIVDDDDDFREIVRIKLEHSGYATVSAKGADEAFEIIKKEPDIGFILVDLVMPNKNGVDFLWDIKSSEEFSKIPALLMSNKIDWEGKIGEAYKRFIAKFGNVDIFDKTKDLDELVVKITSLSGLIKKID